MYDDYYADDEDSQSLDSTLSKMETRECSISQNHETGPTSPRSEENIPKESDSEEGEECDVNKLMPLQASLVRKETLTDVHMHLEHEKKKYARFFKNDEQAEYFLMLPLSEKQRQLILQSISK
jgi:hypothetical protein